MAEKPVGKPSEKPAPDPGTLSFEQALEAVEEIVERIESGQTGLEQAIKEFERGTALLRRCREVLRGAEQRVEELNAQLGELDRPDERPKGRS